MTFNALGRAVESIVVAVMRKFILVPSTDLHNAAAVFVK